MTDDQMPEVEAGCSDLVDITTKIGEAWKGFVHDRAVSIAAELVG